MKTAEEILDEHLDKAGDLSFLRFKATLAAMEDYAKQFTSQPSSVDKVVGDQMIESMAVDYLVEKERELGILPDRLGRLDAYQKGAKQVREIISVRAEEKEVCKKCGGQGRMEESHYTGFIMIDCPDCSPSASDEQEKDENCDDCKNHLSVCTCDMSDRYNEIREEQEKEMNKIDKEFGVEQVEAKEPTDRITKAMLSLLNLKSHKDKNGKDAYYLQNQPIVWEEAFQAFSEYETNRAFRSSEVKEQEIINDVVKIVESFVQPNCSDHTPFRGACVDCGQHSNWDSIREPDELIKAIRSLQVKSNEQTKTV